MRQGIKNNRARLGRFRLASTVPKVSDDGDGYFNGGFGNRHTSRNRIQPHANEGGARWLCATDQIPALAALDIRYPVSPDGEQNSMAFEASRYCPSLSILSKARRQVTHKGVSLRGSKSEAFVTIIL